MQKKIRVIKRSEILAISKNSSGGSEHTKKANDWLAESLRNVKDRKDREMRLFFNPQTA
jgi:hypothetical protein